MSQSTATMPIEHTRVSYEIGLEAAGEVLRDYCGAGLRIATLGPEGSNSHLAAADLSERVEGTDVAIDLCASFAEVLEAAASPDTVSILAATNKVGGVVAHGPGRGISNMEAIRHRGGTILAAIGLPIEHCLVAPDEVEPAELEGAPVYSHPQALRQCSGYIGRLGLQGVEAASTSAAASRLLEVLPEDRAVAIAPSLAAEVYGLHVVAENIGDLPASDNVTTMVVVSV